jgi:glycosyltransferase involved in cell wall biosynthesis
MSASVWIRCLQLLPWLERHGVVSTLNDPNADADIAVFIRMQGVDAQRIALEQRQRGRKVVFDLVVNYFEEANVPDLGQQVTGHHVQECLRMLDLADAVTCASEFIAVLALERHGLARYIPDSVNPEHFRHVKLREDFFRERLRAIWSGYAVKAAELSSLLPLLQERDIDLVIVSEKEPWLTVPGFLFRRHFKCDYVPWNYSTFPESILRGELCLGSRALDTSYNRGHSIFKIGVFMAQGVPALASPVPSYAELLGDESGGRLCVTKDDWIVALDAVTRDRELLVRWSEGARAKVGPFLTPVIAKRYAELFRMLLDE